MKKLSVMLLSLHDMKQFHDVGRNNGEILGENHLGLPFWARRLH